MMKNPILWSVASCFGGTSCFHNQGRRLPYKPEYIATPYFCNEKINKKHRLFLTKLNMSIDSECCKQKEAKIIQL
jgi:hypothetical protein